MTLLEVEEALHDLRSNELARGVDLKDIEVWADSDSEGYRFKVEKAFVKKYSGVSRVILQGD